MITGAVAGTVAAGARAASCVIRVRGWPPVNRASSGGNAKTVRIRATPVTPCLTSFILGLGESAEFLAVPAQLSRWAAVVRVSGPVCSPFAWCWPGTAR